MAFGVEWDPTFVTASGSISSLSGPGRSFESEIFRFGLCVVMRCEGGRAPTQLDPTETAILRHWRGKFRRFPVFILSANETALK
jgi:hypothetical protein